jgi:hypothetical protein
MLRKIGRLKDHDLVWRPGMNIVNAASLDEPYFSRDLLAKHLDDLAAAGSGVLMLYTHDITLTNASPKSHVTLATLTTALQLIREHGLRFYTMSELAAAR